MKKVLILMDQRGFMSVSTLPDKIVADVNLIKNELVKRGFEVEISCIHDIRFPTNYSGWYVIYPSSEDAGLFYKSYIEDILLGLKKEGAILLPDFNLFRAHHNKMYMEIYRKTLDKRFNSLKSVFFYGSNDFLAKIGDLGGFPIVLKTAEGSASAGVYIAHNVREAQRIIDHVSKIGIRSAVSDPLMDMKKSIKKHLERLGLRKKELYKISAKEKMIAQDFVRNLKCDYKVLVFGEKYYVLRRKVRENDFRASGSGRFEHPQGLSDELVAILDFVRELFKELDVPLLSADVAYDGASCHLIEFQCVSFGPYTLEYSNHYYDCSAGNWHVVEQKSSLEIELATAYSVYLNNMDIVSEVI